MIARLDARAPFVFVALLACFGCGKDKSNPTAPLPPSGAPSANSPSQAVRRLEYAYDNRDDAPYRTLFTSDFRFAFVTGDSAGIPYLLTPWSRDDELASFDNLVRGGSVDQPAATAIQLAFDGNLNVGDDTRPGRNPIWHKSVNTNVVLIANFTGGVTSAINGTSKFFLVRGDSALIPGDLGVGPDSTLWYIDRWEDQTGHLGPGPLRRHPIGPARVQPTRNDTWGHLKADYR